MRQKFLNYSHIRKLEIGDCLLCSLGFYSLSTFISIVNGSNKKVKIFCLHYKMLVESDSAHGSPIPIADKDKIKLHRGTSNEKFPMVSRFLKTFPSFIGPSSLLKSLQKESTPWQREKRGAVTVEDYC